MAEPTYPAVWYLLWVVISVCGVGTWYLRNFTQRVETTRMVAFTGVTTMLVMVLWTFISF